MNLSGRAVAQLARFYKVESQDIIVLHDDVDVDFSKVKARVGGSDGGHKGVRSIISCLGSKEFHRIKLGVGKPGLDHVHQDVTRWVLEAFSDEQLKLFANDIYDAALLRLRAIFSQV